MRHSALRSAFAALLFGFWGAGASAGPVEISISCSSLGVELELCRSGAAAWTARSGVGVKLVPTPADANERLSLYLSLLASHSPDVDVFQIDIVWPGALAVHFIDLRPALSEEALRDHLAALIVNDTVEGRLVAAPFFVDAGLLYYRKDLLAAHGRAPPEDWRELEDVAGAIMAAERAAGRRDMQGFVWQGRAYEGLACNALEWISSFGAAWIDPQGGVAVDDPRAVAALKMAKRWIGAISPPGVLNYAEEDARSVFQSGKAVFMRNWPYAMALVDGEASPVRGKVGVALLPKGPGPDGRHAAALGGQHLAVSRYSRHKAEAADLVRYLTSRAEQKRRALEGSFYPTLLSLYDDPDLKAALPFLSSYRLALESAVIRPAAAVGRRYARVSHEFVQTVHDGLSARGETDFDLADLARSLERAKRNPRRP